MINDRRDFLRQMLMGSTGLFVFGLLGCGKETSEKRTLGYLGITSSSRVTLYDTNAMALYYDGSLGPKTGVIKVDYILANKEITLPFWHGHNGMNHQFKLTPEHYLELRRLKKVTIETTIVDNHSHKLFIDPVDPKWRVPGAKPVEVPDVPKP